MWAHVARITNHGMTMTQTKLRIFLGLFLYSLSLSSAYAADSKFIGQVVPARMEAGKQYKISIQFQNNGGGTWDGSYELVSTVKDNPWRRDAIRLSSKTSIANGRVATIGFTIAAPSKPGTYSFQWQMAGSGGSRFGDKTPNLDIVVDPPAVYAEFIHQELPGLSKGNPPFALMDKNKPYKVTVVFKNGGSDNWQGAQNRLVSRNPDNNLTWSIDQVEMHDGELVRPGDIKSFTFNIMTPEKPGIYNFQWQMVGDDNQWFGEASENVVITVR